MNVQTVHNLTNNSSNKKNKQINNLISRGKRQTFNLVRHTHKKTMKMYEIKARY